MRRSAWIAVVLAMLGTGAMAQEEEHSFKADGLTIVHPWARAAAAGGETLVFMEIENQTEGEVLTGATTDASEAVHIVGIILGGADIVVQEIDSIPVSVGHFALDPAGLALELHGLSADLVQGSHFDLVVEFAKAGPVEIEVEVEAADATQHSHAGHSH